jgi:hypothetical protein
MFAELYFHASELIWRIPVQIRVSEPDQRPRKFTAVNFDRSSMASSSRFPNPNQRRRSHCTSTPLFGRQQLSPFCGGIGGREVFFDCTQGCCSRLLIPASAFQCAADLIARYSHVENGLIGILAAKLSIRIAVHHATRWVWND